LSVILERQPYPALIAGDVGVCVRLVCGARKTDHSLLEAQEGSKAPAIQRPETASSQKVVWSWSQVFTAMPELKLLLADKDLRAMFEGAKYGKLHIINTDTPSQEQTFTLRRSTRIYTASLGRVRDNSVL
jgi:hypothetical protein